MGPERHTTLALALGLLFLVGCEEEKTLDRAALLDPESCKTCHSQHYEEWAGSMHAYAADDPVFLAMNRRGQEEAALGTFCVQCHAPMAVREGATTDGLNLPELPQHLKGVTCYFCHSVDAVEGTHNNPLRLADDLVLRGPFADPLENDAHEAAYSPLLDGTTVESAGLCGSCHDIVTDRDVHLERTFAEWKESLFGNGGPGGLSCATCHMRTRPGAAASVPGVPLRDINDHRMPAVDVALGAWPHHEEHVAQVAAELDGTAIGQICVDAFDPARFELTLENAFAGHSFPSGAAQDRRLWVELIAYDDADAVLFETGTFSTAEPVSPAADPSLWLFADRMLDEAGEQVHMFWEAASVEGELLPAAIEPMMLHRVSRTFDMPAPPVRVTFRLLMRPIDVDLIDALADYLDPSLADQIQTFEVIDLVEWTQGGEQCVPPGVF